MTALLPDLALVRRALAITSDYARSRVQIVADRPGNPLRVEIRRFGPAIALLAPPFGEHPFNTAQGFSDDEIADVADVVAWYAAAGVVGAFEIAPGVKSKKLTALLHEHGYRHTAFHATFAGPSDLPQSASDGVEVRQVTDLADLALFSDAYHLGWNHTGMRVPIEPWLSAPGWSLYVGLCDGQPAGVAILYLLDGSGYLADSAVDPRFRGRGVHRALLDRRCADAAAAGADVVFSGANYLSTSHRNMLRKGLTVLFTEAIWTAPQPKAAG